MTRVEICNSNYGFVCSKEGNAWHSFLLSLNGTSPDGPPSAVGSLDLVVYH